MKKEPTALSTGPDETVQGVLSELRSRLLGPCLLLSALIGALNVALCGYHDGGPLAAWRPGLLASALFAFLSLAALSKRVSSGVRIALTLLVMYAASLLSLGTLGLGAGGIIGLFGAVAMTATLLGKRPAVLAFAGSLVALGLVSAGFAHGMFKVLVPQALAPENPWNWLRPCAVGASVVAAVGGVVIFLLEQLTLALEQRIELVARLRTEAQERERAMDALAEAQERLLHAHKLEAVGRLAGGIAHDFNNTLTVILSYAELLKARLSRAPELSELTDQVIHAAEQGGDLTKQLLTFSRRQPVKPRVVDVGQLLKNVERTVSRLVPKSVRVHRAQADEELLVTIDPTQLQQAVLNLALNARDALPEGGDLYLEASASELEEKPELPLMGGKYVRLRVRDTGTGMRPDTLPRIFEPFFTTKEPGRGTGLGLSNVRETVEAAGGHVAVESEPGKGSSFSVYLPRADARVSGIEQTRMTKPPHESRVLVVDDELQIREVIRTMLADSGYQVRVADSARAALLSLEEQPVDLVCTDLVMPDMSGAKLVDELRSRNPLLPVVVCSAYGADESIGQRVARGELLFLSKPFTRRDLLDTVERALSPRPTPRPKPLAG